MPRENKLQKEIRKELVEEREAGVLDELSYDERIYAMSWLDLFRANLHIFWNANLFGKLIILLGVYITYRFLVFGYWWMIWWNF